MISPPGRRLTPKSPLSDVELKALFHVANNTVIDQPMYERLQKLGFVERKSSRWDLTHQGQIQMLFRGAR